MVILYLPKKDGNHYFKGAFASVSSSYDNANSFFANDPIKYAVTHTALSIWMTINTLNPIKEIAAIKFP